MAGKFTTGMLEIGSVKNALDLLDLLLWGDYEPIGDLIAVSIE